MVDPQPAQVGGPDLSTCDREPIHLPGSIQPHGVLLVLAEPELTLVQASANAGDVLGQPPGALLGQPLDALLHPEGVAVVRGGLANPSLERTPLYLGALCVTRDGAEHGYDVIAHRIEGLLVVELEAAETGGAVSFQSLYPLVRSFVSQLERVDTVGELSRVAAAEVRRITGFDRVLIYRFDEGWNGTVVAEDRNEELPSYLDLRFPASDIPRQARELYRVNRLRLIPDAGYTPVPLIAAADARSGKPLDLSFASLRSVSPVHLEYMQNMGTGASMSISILRRGELWGLISCHNRLPRGVPFETRTACDLLGQVLSLQLEARERTEEYEHRMHLRSLQARLLTLMAEEESFVEGLVRHPDELLQFGSAAGAAIVSSSQCRLLGVTPTEDQVDELAAWLTGEVRAEVFHTDALSTRFPPAEAYAATASGLLAASISRFHHSYILWFRPEVVRTVKWGGDPRKPVEPAASGERLHPRKSFEMWKETVRDRSLPWRESEIETAGELRSAIVGIVLRRAEELAALSAELERSNKELEAFSYSVSHDLRAPFRHIVGYSELLRDLEGAALSEQGLRFLDTITESAQHAGTLVDNLLAFSRMGRTRIRPMPVDMTELVRELQGEFALQTPERKITWKLHPLPPAEGDLMMLRLAWHNLIGNAVKYTRTRPEAVIEIGGESTREEEIYFIRDNGIGFDMEYVDKLFGVFQRLHRAEDFEGTGIGLANVRRIIGRHGGRTWGEGVVDGGATFRFTLPRIKHREME